MYEIHLHNAFYTAHTFLDSKFLQVSQGGSGINLVGNKLLFCLGNKEKVKANM